VQWQIPEWTTPGTYRIKLFGDAKTLFGGLMPFTGASNEFMVAG
jgi:neutral ceramidase